MRKQQGTADSEMEMKQPQHMLSMKQPPIRHEISIVIVLMFIRELYWILEIKVTLLTV